MRRLDGLPAGRSPLLMNGDPLGHFLITRFGCAT